MNEGDIANKIRDDSLNITIDNRVRFDSPSKDECVDCGGMIPLERQKLGGVERCVYCQNSVETKNRHYRR